MRGREGKQKWEDEALTICIPCTCSPAVEISHIWHLGSPRCHILPSAAAPSTTASPVQPTHAHRQSIQHPSFSVDLCHSLSLSISLSRCLSFSLCLSLPLCFSSSISLSVCLTVGPSVPVFFSEAFFHLLQVVTFHVTSLCHFRLCNYFLWSLNTCIVCLLHLSLSLSLSFFSQDSFYLLLFISLSLFRSLSPHPSVLSSLQLECKVPRRSRGHVLLVALGLSYSLDCLFALSSVRAKRPWEFIVCQLPLAVAL